MSIKVPSSNELELLRYYSYRSAQPGGPVEECDYERGDAFDSLHQDLAKRAGLRRGGNHESFLAKNLSTGEVSYLLFTDWVVKISPQVLVEAW